MKISLRKKMSRHEAFALIDLLGTPVDSGELASDRYEGVTNSFLGELVALAADERVEIVGDIEELHSCPCCGYRTLSERFDQTLGTGYEICRLCEWEDDGTSTPDEYSGVNGGTIDDFLKHMDLNPNLFHQAMWSKTK